MPQFRKKPVVVNAVQWDGSITTLGPLWGLTKQPEIQQDFLSDDLVIPTLEGEMTAKVGDWIIVGTKGEMYPCKPEIFAEIYEAADA